MWVNLSPSHPAVSKPPARKPATAPAGPKRRRRRPRAPARIQYRWTKRVPLRVRAMVLADKTLFLAGPPDAPGAKERPPAGEGGKGGLLWAVSADDGARLTEHRLDSTPVFDGLAAAGGRLYLSTTAGTVQCFTGR